MEKFIVAEESESKIRNYPIQYSKGYDLTPKPKKKKNYDKLHNEYETIIPTGKDSGKGINKLFNSFINELCSPIKDLKSHEFNTINFNHLSNDFKQLSFLEQVNDIELSHIPSLSQISRENILKLSHTTKEKKFFNDLSNRLKTNDSSLIYVYLASMRVNDSIIKLFDKSLQKNTVIQQLNLHDNKITDIGVEIICIALRYLI